MKKCCKNVNILADDFIEDPIYEALDEKWKRPDVAKYLHGRTSSMSLQAMKRLLRDTDERDLMVSGLIRTVAESLRYEIQNRELKVEPIQYGWRRDGINGKFREIGVESVKQLILDEIASEGLDELWRRKLGYHQYASIKGKGQLGGKRAIEHQIRKKYAQSRYAWKGDVRKCYPSVDTRKLKRMLEHDVKNEVLLYLVFFLIGTYKQGLNIGSGLSQFLCNYYLSKAYRVEIPLEIAYKCTSYYGWFKHTDSKYVKDKYNIDAVCAAAKRRISKHAKSEIYGASARSALAACQ